MNDSLNLIPQGVTESSRVGRKCKVTRLDFKGQMVLPSTDLNTTDEQMRIIVYLDKQCNGTAATILDILETASINSFRNLSNTNRFSILSDKTVAMTAKVAGGSTAISGDMLQSFRRNISVNAPLEFSNTTGALTEIRSNNIGLLAITLHGQASLGYTCRVRFSDV